MAPSGIPLDTLWKERLRRGLSESERLPFSEFVLSRVSRTFALNIRVLPRSLQSHVLHAYLYCRMADTLEDDPVLEPAGKIRLLGMFAAFFKTDEAVSAITPQTLREFRTQLPPEWIDSTHWEHLLLVHASELLIPFEGFPEPVKSVLSRCILEMCAGMEGFLTRQIDTGGLNLIESIDDLDRYCYYVAGTVGVLLCELFIRNAHLAEQRARSLRDRCVSFGLGLQLTNILKDLHDDKDRNISWLPGELLKAEQMTFEEFVHSPAKAEGRRRIQRILILKTRKHLEDALEYSCLIPRKNRRLRLFCLWPLLMAAETLALLAENLDVIVRGARVKIPRTAVKRIVTRTQLLWWSNRWIRSEFQKSISRLEKALAPLNANSFTLGKS